MGEPVADRGVWPDDQPDGERPIEVPHDRVDVEARHSGHNSRVDAGADDSACRKQEGTALTRQQAEPLTDGVSHGGGYAVGAGGEQAADLPHEQGVARRAPGHGGDRLDGRHPLQHLRQVVADLGDGQAVQVEADHRPLPREAGVEGDPLTDLAALCRVVAVP